MKMQSAMAANIAESIFRSVVAGVTNTSATVVLHKGEPVVLAIKTATIGVAPVGQEVIRALTVTDLAQNRLVVGVVADDHIAHEAVGLVQVYGVATVRLAEAATVAVGDKLVPGLNSTATALAPYGRGCWQQLALTGTVVSTSMDVHWSPMCGVFVLEAATAVSGTNSYTDGTAFIRAL